MKLLNFGSCNLDYVYNVEQFVRPGETKSVSSMEVFLGGKGLNQSVAVAKSGAAIAHAGCIGPDGEKIYRALDTLGVDLTHLKRSAAPTGHAIIQVVPSGENCILILPGANGQITPEDIDGVLSAFSADTLLILQNEISNLEHLIQAANARGMQICLNPAPFTAALRTIDLSLLTFLILNETEAAGFTGEEDPHRSLDWFARRYPHLQVIITLGSRGCLYQNCATGERISHPAFCVHAVDTTAAGDTFVGYFVSVYAAAGEIPSALRIASAAAALTTTRAGASPSIPTMEEVQTALATLVPRSGTEH